MIFALLVSIKLFIQQYSLWIHSLHTALIYHNIYHKGTITCPSFIYVQYLFTNKSIWLFFMEIQYSISWMHILSHLPFYMLVSIVWYLFKNVLIYLFVYLFVLHSSHSFSSYISSQFLPPSSLCSHPPINSSSVSV